MPPTPPQLNPNSFQQTAVRGQLDLNIAARGVVAGLVSPSQATPIKAGDAVKLDPANTVLGTPTFLSADVNEDALGISVFTVKAATLNPGDPIEVALLTGPAMWEVCDTNPIAPGSKVDHNADGNMEPHGTTAGSKARGIALDPGTPGELFRVLITNPVA